MKLSDIYEKLAYGEFSMLAVGDVDSNTPGDQDYNNLIPIINLGLLDLYKRFPLKNNSVKLTLDATVTKYQLSPDYLVSNTSSTQPIKYLDDTVECVMDSGVIKLEAVYTSAGQDLLTSSSEKLGEVSLAEYNTLRVHTPVHGTELVVKYRAAHKSIPIEVHEADEVEISLPIVMEEALLLYIAYKKHLSINTDGLNEGMQLLNRYEAVCAALKRDFTYHNNYTNSSRLITDGWV